MAQSNNTSGDFENLRKDAENLSLTSGRDHAVSGIKAALAACSGVPGAGIVLGPLQSLIDDYVPRQSNERVFEFCKDLVEHLGKLESKFDGQYVKSDDFASLFVRSFDSVRRDFHGDKLKYFRILLVNSVVRQDVAFDKKQMYLHTLDSLLPAHLEVLALLHDPQRFVDSRNLAIRGGMLTTCLSNLIGQALPHLAEHEVSVLIGDLDSKGLTQNMQGSLNTMMSGGGIEKLSGRLPKFATDFIRFVTTNAQH